MCGVYTDNQPDFSWLHPYEEKSFKQYFMPYQEIGMVKNATKEALLNLEVEEGLAEVKVYVTSNYPQSQIILKSETKTYFLETQDLTPKSFFKKKVAIADEEAKSLTVEVKDKSGKILVTWCNSLPPPFEVPEAAKPAKVPREIENTEQLYLSGLHLEQYRHATYDPMEYYTEAIKREPGDVRNNNAIGLWFLKRGQFKKSIPYFDRAIETLTERNPNPIDSEAYFNKGMAHRYLGMYQEAYNAFYKACWNAAWQDAGYFNLAQIDASNGRIDRAIEMVDKALIRNWHNHRARHLKVSLLREKGALREANELIIDSLKIDAFNFGVNYEKYLIGGQSKELKSFKELLRDHVHNYIEVSLEYTESGQINNAIALLKLFVDIQKESYPMVHYLLAWYYQKIGDTDQAISSCQMAQKAPLDYCFPNRLEEVIALQAAIDIDASDAKAPYYLGNFWYASSQYEEARKCWEKAKKIDNTNPICLRNLALLYYNKLNRETEASQNLEKAFALDNKNPRLMMELDQLKKKNNQPLIERLHFLEINSNNVSLRDDLYLERVSLYNQLGEYQKALELIADRNFHPWEGGEGKVSFQYITANIELAKWYLKKKEPQKSITYLNAAMKYPINLGEGKLHGAQENDIFYWLGIAYELLEEKSKAITYFEKASEGKSDPNAAIFYNDQKPDKILYQGLALLKLDLIDEANIRFHKLIQFGKDHMEDDVKLDYFAVSLPDLLIWEEDLNERNKIHCSYLIGLGYLGLQQFDKAKETFETVLKKDSFHLPAHIHFQMANQKF